MKYSGASFTLLLVDGFNLASAITENASMGWEVITQETSPFGSTGVSESHTPIGKYKGFLTAGGGLFDAATDALHSAIGTVVGVSRVVCAAIFGNTIGKPFIGYAGAYSQKYEVLDVKDGLTKANVAYLVSGDVEEGQIIQDHAQFSATWDTKTGGANATDAPVDFTLYDDNRPIVISSNTLANPTVITSAKEHGLITGQKVLISGSNSTPTIDGDRAVTVISATTFSVAVNVTVAGTAGSFVKSSTTLGGAGYAQCSQYAGITNLVLKIMHSPDDTTYAAKVTFATITAVTKERVAVSGTIDRYLSSQGTVTGAGTVTVFSGFSRN